jgi:hypothetical protein
VGRNIPFTIHDPGKNVKNHSYQKRSSVMMSFVIHPVHRLNDPCGAGKKKDKNPIVLSTFRVETLNEGFR